MIRIRGDEALDREGHYVVKCEDSACDQSDEKSEAAENWFAEPKSCDGEYLGLDEPENRPAYAVETKGNRGDKENDGDGGEDDECLTAFRFCPPGKRHLEGAEEDERPEGPLGMRGLEFEKPEYSGRVDDGRDAGDVFFALIERSTKDIGEAEDEPVKQDERGGWPELSKAGVILRQDFTEPDEMADIDGDQTAELEHRPVIGSGDDDECDGEDGACCEGEDDGFVWVLDVTGQQGSKAQQERERGDGLGSVKERVADHSGGDEEHQDKVEGKRMKYTRCLKVVRSEGCEVGKGPTASNSAAGEDAVGWFAFEPDTTSEEDDADGESAENFATGAPGLEFP